jgi:hypothetical protein
MAATETKLPKPQLRRLHNGQIRTNLIVAVCLIAGIVTSMKLLRNDQRKKNYAEFYRYGSYII